METHKPFCRSASLLFLLALVAIGGGLVTDAGCSCRRETPFVPPDELWTLNNQGVAEMERFDHLLGQGIGFIKAIPIFEEVVERWPQWTPGRFNLAAALIYHQKIELSEYEDHKRRAKSLLEGILKENPQDPRAHFLLGVLLQYEQHNDEALPHFQDLCTELAPDDAYCWIHLGACLEAQMGDDEPGTEKNSAISPEKCYERAIELNPNLLPAYHHLSQYLLQHGQRERAELLIEEFQKRSDRGDYQEASDPYIWAGTLGEVIGAPAPPPRPAAKPVSPYQWSETARFELADGVRWATNADLRDAPHGALLTRIRRRFGAGVVAFDYDGDGRLDLLLLASAIRDGQLSDTLLRNDGDGHFTDVTAEARLAGARTSLGCAVGDFDCDGRNDLYITAAGGNLLLRNTGQGTFEDVTERAGAALADTVSLSAYFLDVDHDGDLDLLVANYGPLVDEEQMFGAEPFRGGAANALFLNVGKARLTDEKSQDLPPLEVDFERAEQAGVWDHAAPTVGFAAADFDNDRDLDLVEINDRAPCRLLFNLRLQKWRAEAIPATLIPPQAYNGALVGDFNNDGNIDLALVAAAEPTRILLNEPAGIDKLPAFRAAARDLSSLITAQAVDADFDGWLDLVGLGEKTREPVLLLNQDQGFVAQSGWLPKELSDKGAVQAILMADFLETNRPQFIILHDGEAPSLLAASGADHHGFLLKMTGRRESRSKITKIMMRSNSNGLGSRVTVNAGRQSTAWENTTLGSGLCRSLLPLPIGLAERDQADAVRIHWSDGVEQAELNTRCDQTITIEEQQRRGDSCPLLFAWNGRRYEFINDILGGAGLGVLEAPGVFSTPDPDEDVKIEALQLAPNEQGQYVLKIAEPMDEMTYLDSADLEVIDHPAELSVYPDERFDPAAPHPSGGRMAFREPIVPAAARDQQGRDVLAKLAAWDRNTVDGFRTSAAWIGYAEEHAVELDFGRAFAAWHDDQPAALFLAGWVEYPYSQTNWAAGTAGEQLRPPVLEWLNERGQWETLIENMGYPAGLTRMMTVDLTGKLPAAVRAGGEPIPCRLRIRTNMEIYWDQIFAARLEPLDQVRRTTLLPCAAQLGYHGCIPEVSPDGRRPMLYDYQQPSAAPLVGLLGERTPYGDVLAKVLRRDDGFVLVNAGDEVTLTYDAKALPPLPPGWKRSFILRVAGYAKDVELFNPLGRSVEPLPKTKIDSPRRR